MTLITSGSKVKKATRLLQWLNLRPEEAERTLLMFLFYTMTSVGLLWAEASSVALFLENYSPAYLPFLYIFTALMGSVLGFFYDRLQKILSLRKVIVLVAMLMAFGLLIFRFGLEFPYINLIAVFLMRLWVEGIDGLSNLNISITANQLFNIREIKRTYPLISSAILVADVVSGFSLPLILKVGLNNVSIVSSIMIFIGSIILFYLTTRYRTSFPDLSLRESGGNEQEFISKRLKGPLQRYVIPLFGFFVIGQVMYLLIDFQFLTQLDQQYKGQEIANFLGFYSGILGLLELFSQWFLSSRIIENVGVFIAAMILPTLIVIFGIISISGIISLFIGLTLLKFIDELFRYTLLSSLSPVLFQPVPDQIRNSVQAAVRGIAEPTSTGLTGLGILAISNIFIFYNASPSTIANLQGVIFVLLIIIFALIWLLIVRLLRSTYLSVLVQSTQVERLSFANVDLKTLKKTILDKLENPSPESDQHSCIELLYQIDPKNISEILAPLLNDFTSNVIQHSLETMLKAPNPNYLQEVKRLIHPRQHPEILSLALRYVWIGETTQYEANAIKDKPDISQLQPYLQPHVNAIVRGTAAALILRSGEPTQKAEATNTLRQMLTHKKEIERVMGCRALGEASYLQALRVYIPHLLQDQSLRVRCALLEVIASTHLEEYYPSLVRALYYKSTREAALQALIKLHDEAIPKLVDLGNDIHKPDLVRLQAWIALSQIGSSDALGKLVLALKTSWGITRRNVLRILLKMPNEQGIEGAIERLGRNGIEFLITQEIIFIGHLLAAQIDLSPLSQIVLKLEMAKSENQSATNKLDSESSLSLLILSKEEANLLRRSLRDVHNDTIERCFLLLKLLYPHQAIQAASFNIQSNSPMSIARGLEILDHTIDISIKPIILALLDNRSEREKVQILNPLLEYKPLVPQQRLAKLLELRHFLPDWSLACCFHLARAANWKYSAQLTLMGLRHPTGFVREAVFAYLKKTTPKSLKTLIPQLRNDPDRLVTSQIREFVKQYGR